MSILRHCGFMKEESKRFRVTVFAPIRPFIILIVMAVASISFSVIPAVATNSKSSVYWIWPTGVPVQVTAPFDPPPEPWNSGHRGVDLNVAIGETIASPAPGTVVYAGVLAGRPVISILHAGGLRSTYEPVDSLVVAGDSVQAGTPIGLVSEEGTGNHLGLHWGARFGKDEYIDPLRMLVGPSILKPWD